MPRKEQLQPVRNEASLQADGTYTTNSRFDKYINTEIHKNTNKQQITSLTNTQKMQACLPGIQRAQQHGCQVTEVLITRSFGKPEMIITFNYITLH